MLGDPLGLAGLVRSLVDNALDYGRGRSVLLELRPSAGQAIVRVCDSGIGIPEHERSKVFDPFYRASNVLGTSGHGLGLSIARRIVEQHRGRSGWKKRQAPVRPSPSLFL